MLRLFGHYVPRVFVYLAIIEWLLMVLAVIVGARLRFPWNEYLKLAEQGGIWVAAPLFATLLVIAMAATGMYQRGFSRGQSAIIARVLVALAGTVVAISLLFYAFPYLFIGRGAVTLSVIAAFALLMVSRALFLRFVSDASRYKRVLVLGVGEAAHTISELQSCGVETRFRVAGFVDMGESGGRQVEGHILPSEQLGEWLVDGDIDEVVVAMDDRRQRLPTDELLALRSRGVVVLDLLGFFEREVSRLPVDKLTPGWLIFSDAYRRAGFASLGKRLLDVLAAALLLLVSWPVMLLVALGIKLEDGLGAEVLYRQRRVGLDGKEFNVLKFRSMRTDAERDGVPRFAGETDDRVTRVGAIIRKVRLDELPQIFNVLIGSMSFVGPRPERPHFVAQFQRDIPYYHERHRVKPGITGWAQLCYQYGASEEDARAKLEYDLYYVKNSNLFLDLLIILRTVEIVLWGKGGR